MTFISQLIERRCIDKYVFLFILTVSLTLASCFSVAGDSNKKVTHHRVLISGFEFVPDKLQVKKGDSITWVNKDIAPHNVMMSNYNEKISPNLLTDEEFTFKITSGFDYECGLHPSMIGKIIISD